MPIGSSLGISLPVQGANTNTWGSELNTELNKIITAVEAQVPAAAIDFSADFDLNNNALTRVKATTYDQQASYAPLNSVYVDSNGNLYFRDGGNNNVQITASGALNNASAGGLGDSGGTYGSSGITFDWDGSIYNAKNGSGSDDYADIRISKLRLRDGSSNTLTVSAPSMGADYTFTLPSAVPAASTTLLQMDTSGNVTASNSTGVDITLTGSAKVVHGNRTLSLSASSAALDGFASYNVSTDEVTFGTSSSSVNYPLALPFGSRIVDITYNFFGGDSGAKLCGLYRKTGVAGTAATAVSTISPTNSGVVGVSDTGINHTLLTGQSYFIKFRASSTSTTDRVATITVVYDVP